ncbi:MAG TPA: glycosyltransferase family 39 protein [Tepidisphaeraceae bacterium]|nr:glycosyltransferase family 39 protein [Tepidisphaeraceae bacterium]
MRWYCWVILAGLIAVGAGLRFYQITKVGQWPDEFWSSVHLATGRGMEIFDLPAGVLLDPPPRTMLAGAPSWPHIWTGLRNVVHPPLYFICLRWWMDLFGPGDFSTRTFSAVASLGGVIVLFDIVRRTSGAHAGLLAATLMAVSPLQMNLSQETRPYPLLILFGLLACHAIVRIEQDGISPGKLIQLGLATGATALTHYFSIGALAGIFLYGVIRLRGSVRTKVLALLLGVGALVLICWGPFLWQQRHEFFRQQDWSLEPTANRNMALARATAVPSELLYGRSSQEMAWIAPAVIAYLLPIVLWRRMPYLLLWWLWIVGVVGPLAAYDWVHDARLLATLKYTSLASVGMYALCAAPLPTPKWWRWVVAYMILASTIIVTIERLGEGPTEQNGDWRGMAQALDRLAGPGDPLVFYPNKFWGSPGMYYLAFSHYAQDSQRPVMFLNEPADADALQALSKYPRVWLVGPEAAADGEKYLRGWKVKLSRWFPNSGSMAEMQR